MDKTVTVETMTLRHHPLYRKAIRYRKRLLAHDENNRCQVGDLVRITESSPLSKRKRWRVVEIVRSGGGLIVSGEIPEEEVLQEERDDSA